MLLRRAECDTEQRRVFYWGEKNVILRRGECDTEERGVCY